MLRIPEICQETKKKSPPKHRQTKTKTKTKQGNQTKQGNHTKTKQTKNPKHTNQRKNGRAKEIIDQQQLAISDTEA